LAAAKAYVDSGRRYSFVSTIPCVQLAPTHPVVLSPQRPPERCLIPTRLARRCLSCFLKQGENRSRRVRWRG
jgi:hypothetical protein